MFSGSGIDFAELPPGLDQPMTESDQHLPSEVLLHVIDDKWILVPLQWEHFLGCILCVERFAAFLHLKRLAKLKVEKELASAAEVIEPT
jgi:hypothetical protein